MMGGGAWCVNNTTATCTMRKHGERWGFGGIFTKVLKQPVIHWVGCGQRRRGVQEEEMGFPPMQSPSFRNTHGVHSDPRDAHPSKFVLLQPPSLFSPALSLCWRFPVSSLLPSLPLSLFFPLPPSTATGGLYFFKGQLNFTRQAHNHTWSRATSCPLFSWRIHIGSATSALII